MSEKIAVVYIGPKPVKKDTLIRSKYYPDGADSFTGCAQRHQCVGSDP